MKRFALSLLMLMLFVVSCLDKDHYEEEQGNRFFIYKNTIPYYFYDSTGNSMIVFNNGATYPLSYVGSSLPSNIQIEAATNTYQFLSNYDGVGIDSLGCPFWYSYNKGCYDSTHFSYYVYTPYLRDTIDIEYKFDTVSTYDVIISLHKLTYNGVVIRAYEYDSTKLITSDHVDVFKYKDRTVVKPVYKENGANTTTTK